MHLPKRPINLNDLVNKNEQRLFIVHLVLSTLFWLVIIFLTLGKALVFLTILAISHLFTQSALIAWVKGNGIKISAGQFPELFDRFINAVIP